MPACRLRYQTFELRGLDLHIRSLRDRNQFDDPDEEARALGISSAAWPLFGLVWNSGLVLADLMIDRPIAGLRILEVGCGLGLASLVLSLRGADITASDHHPEAESFLRANVALNGGPEIPFFRAGWTEPDCGMGRFDLIIGSDVLYERAHAGSLASFVERHALPHGSVLMVDPGRRNGGRFLRSMEAHGWTGERAAARQTDLTGDQSAGHVLSFDR